MQVASWKFTRPAQKLVNRRRDQVDRIMGKCPPQSDAEPAECWQGGIAMQSKPVPLAPMKAKRKGPPVNQFRVRGGEERKPGPCGGAGDGGAPPGSHNTCTVDRNPSDTSLPNATAHAKAPSGEVVVASTWPARRPGPCAARRWPGGPACSGARRSATLGVCDTLNSPKKSFADLRWATEAASCVADPVNIQDTTPFICRLAHVGTYAHTQL